MNEETLDSIMTDEDKEELAQLQFFKKNILKNIGIKNFINIIREIIDDSEKFEFTSAIKRKFINEITPIFTIKLKEYQKPTAKDLNNNSYLNSEINRIVKMISEDILSKTTEYILKFIENDEKLKTIYSDISEDLRGILWSTIYEIKVSVKDNIIYMRYCI